MAARRKTPSSTTLPARRTRGIAPTVNAGGFGPQPSFRDRLLFNAMSMRRDFLNKLMDPRRDHNFECGYPDTGSINAHELRELYDREPIATRVVNVLPRETWQCQPEVYETEDQDKTTPFEMAWDNLGRALKGESWHQDAEGNGIWEHLTRADELSGIGHFGVLLIGLDDGKQLYEPVEGMDPAGKQMRACEKTEITFVDDEGNEVTESEMLAREQAEQQEAEGVAPTGGGVAQAGAAGPNAGGRPGSGGVAGGAGPNGVAPAGKPAADGGPKAVGTATAKPPATKPEDVTDDEVLNFLGISRPAPEEDDDEKRGQDAADPSPGVATAGGVRRQDSEPSADGPRGELNGTTAGAGDAASGAEPEGEGVGGQDAAARAAGQAPSPTQGTEAQYHDAQAALSPKKKAKLDGGRKLLFLKAFDESLVQITKYEADITSPRFGQPTEYLITLNDPRDQQGGVGLSTATVTVHWTRVVHIADNRGSSEVMGVPRMRPVLNRLLDLRKLYGGSAEMYWRGAFPGHSIETHPQLGGDVQVNPADMREQIENYDNGLSRWLTTLGFSVKSLAPQVVDPTPQIKVQLEAICIELGIPMRVFMGSERGELASSQDTATWNDRLRHRQNTYVTPRLIVPFVDRLISMGVLPQPTGYSVKWEGLDALSEMDKATVAKTKTEAMGAYVGGGVEALMSPEDWLVRILGVEPDEAVAIMEAAAEAEPLDVPGAGMAAPQVFDADGNPADPETGKPLDAYGNPVETDADGEPLAPLDGSAKAPLVAPPGQGGTGGPPKPPGAGPQAAPGGPKPAGAGKPPAGPPQRGSGPPVAPGGQPRKPAKPPKPPVANTAAAAGAPVSIALEPDMFDAMVRNMAYEAGLHYLDIGDVQSVYSRGTNVNYVRKEEA